MWPRRWWGRSARGGTAWNCCARIFWRGRGDEFSPEGIWIVIYRLVHLLPREHPARLPQLTRMGGPGRLGGALTQKPWENSNLPGILWVGDKNEERRRMVGCQSFEAYLEEKFPGSRRKAYCLMSIHDQLRQIPVPEIEELGWSKALELAKVARGEGRRFDCATWLHRARESTKQELKEAVHKYFTGTKITSLTRWFTSSCSRASCPSLKRLYM